MMPGETTPAANTAAIAAEAATACASCGALQQNLNEYVAALIALKQKIIDADQLLTEYQQKCNELQFAKRENNTLHYQVEQMVQKISPLKKCQEELGSVKAELEEKKSSLKIYQETHLEYVRLKEEMDKSDSMKKKLESKVKKLEEAAAKHTLEFKQLKAEKKVLEKELKKAQEKIGGFPNKTQKKVLKNAETQSESENLATNVDKEKIKLLLEELWECVEGSTGKRQVKKRDHVLEALQNPKNMKKFEGRQTSGCSSELSTTQIPLASLQMKVNKKPAGNGGPVENTTVETSKTSNSTGASEEGRAIKVTAEAELATSNMDFLNKEQEEFGESLRDVLKWIRPLPPLLSPIQFSPAATPDILFGDITDSSDDEMDQNAQMLENIIEKCDDDKPTSNSLPSTDTGSYFFSTSSMKTNPQEPCESVRQLQNEESVVLSDSVTATSKYLNDSNTKSKDEQKHLEENSDYIQMCPFPEIATPGTEKLSKKIIDMIETKDSILLPDNLGSQEENIEPMLVQEMVTNNIDHELENTNDFIQEEKEELIETTEGDLCQVPKGDEQQQTKEFILTAEITLIPSKKIMAPSSDEKDIAENVKLDVYSGEAIVLCEKHAEHNTVEEQSIATEGKSELLIEEKMNVSTCKFLSETNHITEQVQQPGTGVMCIESVEKTLYPLQEPISSHCLEETGNKQSESVDNGKNESMATLRSNSHSVMLTDELKQSPYHADDIIRAGSNALAENVADGTTEESKSAEVQKEKCLKQEPFIHENKFVKSPQQESNSESDDRLSAQASITKDSERLVEAGHVVSELENIADSASPLGQVENAGIKAEHMSNVGGLSSCMEDFYPLRKHFMEKNCESVKLTAVETTQTVTAELSEKTSLKTQYNIELSSAMHEHLETEKNNVTVVKDVFGAKKYAIEEKEMNYEYSATSEVDTVQNMDKGPLQSIENMSPVDSGDTKSGLPDTVASDSVAHTESMEVTASNFEVSSDFFCRHSQNSDAANIPSSAPDCIAPSSPNREDADHVDQHNSEEDWKSRKTTTAESKVEEHNLWNCDSPCNRKDEAGIEQDRGDGISSELQASVTVKSFLSGENCEILAPEATCLNNINTIDISGGSTLLLNHEELLIPGDKNVSTTSDNEAVDYTLDEETAKEADDLINTEIRSRGMEECSVLVMNSSVSDSSEEEVYPLRKVNCTKIHPEFAVSRDISVSVINSEAALLISMPFSDGIGHEMSPVVQGGEISKDEKAEKHDSGSHVNEVVERTWKHSYAAVQPCSNENAALKMEDSLAIEMLEERQIARSVSLVASLPSQDLIYNKAACGKSSAGDPDVKDDRVGVHTKYTSNCQVQPDPVVEKMNVEQKRSISTSGSSSNLEQSCITICHVNDGADTSHNKIHDVNNDNQIFSPKTSWKSVSPISKYSNSTNRQQKIETEKLEPLIAFSKNSAEQIFNPSDSDFVKAQADVSGADSRPISKRKRKNRPVLLSEPILANAITSTPAECYPKSLTKIMQEMGPPLPPLLPPLITTPPRIIRPISPIMSTSSHSSLPSPLDELISPVCKTPVPSLMSAPSENSKRKSSSLSSTLTTLSPCEMSVGQRTVSSPLQFCAATPKHALPVPGRLPSSAVGSAVPSSPQENSVEILDSMYPELSARARTLNILKGNVRFSRSSSLDVKNTHQISGYKAITSTSTAFVKTGTVFKSKSKKLFPTVNETGKRILASATMPKCAKRPCLDSKSSTVGLRKEGVLDADTGCPPDDVCLHSGNISQSSGACKSILVLEKERTDDSDRRAVTLAMEKLSEACFDLLPVIRSHVLVGNTSKVPVMRDEEKQVVYELCVEKKSLAEPALQAILKKLKKQEVSLGHNYIQSLCRVYVGICRQLGDLEKARLFCYTLLKEDFPRSAQLILFITNVWSEIFSSESVINKAIQLVVRQRAKGEVLKCLKTYLNWEESASVDISMMISSLLWAIQLCPQMEFQTSREYGEDLKENTWQYVFAIDLLCSHKKWCWTHDNIISKELWPIMDNWIKNRKSNGSVSSPSDIIIATVLRLIGRLGQIGLREGFFSPVENISSIIGAFLQHSKEKGVAWGVQLAAAYALLDLGPSNPSRILEAIHAWTAVNTTSLPSAVLNGIAEVSSLLTHTGRREDCSSA